MLYFPQLTSGTVGQYPIQKNRVTRTLINTCLDGSTVKFADSGSTCTEWQLAFENLTDAELIALEEFVDAAEGRLNAFLFLDPTGNLLAWSDTLDQPTWEKSSLLQILPNIADPFSGGTASRLTNPTSSDLTIQQTVSVPGWLRYCFSLYARDPAGAEITVFRQSESADTHTNQLTQKWRRFQCSGTLNTTAFALTVGVVIPAGRSMEVFGMQLEAQPSASPYKRTYSTGAVFPAARLADDVLEFTTAGPNRHYCIIRIIANQAG